MMYHFNKKISASPLGGFTFIEVLYALALLALICSTVFVVINRQMNAVSEDRLRMECFELARENLEKVLAKTSVEETLEFGVSDKNPAIEWQTVIEPFSDSGLSNMWLRAVCTATYHDSNDQPKKVELTSWLCEVPKEIAARISRDKELLADSDLGVQDYNDPLLKGLNPQDEYGNNYMQDSGSGQVSPALKAELDKFLQQNGGQP